MKSTFGLLIFLLFVTISSAQDKKLIANNCSRGCTGSEYCASCKNCSGCKHCAKEGGTCGVCSPSKKTSKAKSVKKKRK
ncbi:hypothetical protein [Flavobacterium sp. XGLA_31]|uniref:hypothetical protein n=1 Tax=Flavobacterium sp. XGLA_31 TaxID=3447666 RepID=UPI003F3471F2